MALLLSLLISLQCFARLEKMMVKEGSFTYQNPEGVGEVEKIELGISKKIQSAPYPIFINRLETALVFRTEYIDFSWQDPMAFFHDMEKFDIKQVNMNIGSKHHYIRTPKITFQPKESGEFLMTGLEVNCQGHSTASRLDPRLMDDCIEHMDLHVLRLEIPTRSFIAEFLRELPEVEAEGELPAWDVEMLMNKGDFKLNLRIRYYISAGVYAWGHAQFEDDHKVLAIRLDRVKYGYLPVTSLLFKKLRESVNSPNIVIDEPWIRIKMRNN